MCEQAKEHIKGK